MAKTVIKGINESVVDAYINRISGRIRFTHSFLEPMAGKRSGNKISFTGPLYTAKGSLTKVSDNNNLVLNSRLTWLVKVAFIIFYGFFSMFLIYDKVTINGNPPDFQDRLIFVIVSYVAITIPLLLVLHGRDGFLKKIKQGLIATQSERLTQE